MKVTIPRVTEHNGYPGNLMTIEISDNCPACGAPRGSVYKTVSYDGSRRLHCDGWINPCGHVDTYLAVRTAYYQEKNKPQPEITSPLNIKNEQQQSGVEKQHQKDEQNH